MTGLVVGLGCDASDDSVDVERIDGRNVGAFGNDHGYVAVTLEDAAEPMLPGTVEIGVRLYYGGCFEDFYRREHQWRADGERGGSVFDSAMRDDLCGDDEDGVGCSVADLHQNLRGDAKLVADYEVDGPLDGRTLRVGPLPTRTLAGCDPEVPVYAGQLEVWGRAADGTVLWTASVEGIPAHQDDAPVVVVDGS